MKVLNKNILIKEVKEKKMVGGLDVTNLIKEEDRYYLGKAFQVGLDVENVKNGDDIYYDKNRSYQVTLDGERYSVISESDVVVIL
jgi:co-chaperonin GroES (HSP10)